MSKLILRKCLTMQPQIRMQTQQNVQTDYRQKETKYMTHGCTNEVGQTIYRVALNTSLEYLLVSDCCSHIFVSGMSIDV